MFVLAFWYTKTIIKFFMSCRRTYILDKKKDRENTDVRMLIQALQGIHLHKIENKGSLGIEPRRNCTHFLKKNYTWSPGADFFPIISLNGIN